MWQYPGVMTFWMVLVVIIAYCCVCRVDYRTVSARDESHDDRTACHYGILAINYGAKQGCPPQNWTYA